MHRLGQFQQRAGLPPVGPEDRLSFVLPLATGGTGRDDLDLVRARLLLTSLDRFFDHADLDLLLVVTPERDLAAARAVTAEFASTLRIQVVAEPDLCPELAHDPTTINLWPRPNKGWFRQQLIKLAAHAHVRTPFYMTLDADVLFVRPFGVATLIEDSRALLGMLTAQDLRSLFHPEIAAHEISVRDHRMKQAEAVLGLQRPAEFAGSWCSETPALLSRDVVADMARHLEATWSTGWREALLERLPWTEYAIYGLFAEATGKLEQFHRRSGMDAVLRISDSLWRPAGDYLVPSDLDGWNVERAFRKGSEGVAVVVQSYLGYGLTDVAGRVGSRLCR
jgi:hypothetical protein